MSEKDDEIKVRSSYTVTVLCLDQKEIDAKVAEVVAKLPTEMQEAAKAFPPGSHAHLPGGTACYVWGYSSDGKNVVFSAIPSTKENSSKPGAHDNCIPIPLKVLQEMGIVPCGHLLSGYGSSDQEPSPPDWEWADGE
jgi:hypothetical protein